MESVEGNNQLAPEDNRSQLRPAHNGHLPLLCRLNPGRPAPTILVLRPRSNEAISTRQILCSNLSAAA